MKWEFLLLLVGYRPPCPHHAVMRRPSGLFLAVKWEAAYMIGLPRDKEGLPHYYYQGHYKLLWIKTLFSLKYSINS